MLDFFSIQSWTSTVGWRITFQGVCSPWSSPSPRTFFKALGLCLLSLSWSEQLPLPGRLQVLIFSSLNMTCLFFSQVSVTWPWSFSKSECFSVFNSQSMYVCNKDYFLPYTMILFHLVRDKITFNENTHINMFRVLSEALRINVLNDKGKWIEVQNLYQRQVGARRRFCCRIKEGKGQPEGVCGGRLAQHETRALFL